MSEEIKMTRCPLCGGEIETNDFEYTPLTREGKIALIFNQINEAMEAIQQNPDDVEACRLHRQHLIQWRGALRFYYGVSPLPRKLPDGWKYGEFK